MTQEKKIKLNKIICSHCKANLHIRPTEKTCPVCGNDLPETGK